MNQRISAVLLLISVLLFVCNYFLISWEQHAISQVEKNLHGLITQQRNDLVAWSQGQNSDPDFQKRTLCHGRLESWSDDRPFQYDLTIDSIGVVENENGIFLFQTLQKDHCQYFSGYPLYQEFSISNQYLKNRRGDKLTYHVKGIAKKGTYNFQGLVHYEIKPSPSPLIDAIIGLILLLVFLVEYVKFARKRFPTFLIATAILILVRLISLKFEVFDLLFRFALFDPIHFTSSFLNPTLGDLFINAVLVVLLCILLTKFFKEFTFKGGWFILVILSGGLALLVFHVPWSILNNSQLSFNVGDSINFSYLRWIAYLSVVLVCSAYFFFTYYLQQFLLEIQVYRYAIVAYAMAGLLLLFLNPLLTLPLCITIAMLYFSRWTMWNNSLGNFNYQNLLYILAVSVAFGALLSFYTYKHGERAELFAKKKFANYLLLKRDVLGEYYLSQSVEKLSNDTTLMMIASDGTREELENSILNEFSGPYFNKYSIEIVFQDYQRLKVNTRFTRENGLLTTSSFSDYENIHFIDQGTNFKYIAKLNIGDLVGLVIFQLKKRVPTTVYPALLTDSKFVSASSDFDYAVFSGNDILFHRSKFGQGEWPQETDFENSELYQEGIEKNGKHYFGIKTNDGRTILIISREYPLRAQFANFSFFFLLLLLAFSSMSASTSIYHTKKAGLNFTSKIQLYLSIAFIAPLFTSGFALLTTLNSSYKEEINRSYLKQALYISEMLSERLEEMAGNQFTEEVLNEISDFVQSDISYYNASGYLMSTSQPDIFNLGLQSNLVNPVVFSELIRKDNQSMIADESIGFLDYKVCYAVVNSLDNSTAGFIAMPFFDSRNHLRRQQIDVFDNLIIIFAFIFIIAILIGNFVLNNLLQPLRMVAGKIRHITLQDVNQPIQYESSDEIGSLVKDYNQMLVKLEESKQALAKSQKETAWKEIAKQVAHEIKNPLTPMQLKIQQLIRRFEKGTKEYDSLASLLTQVDTLSQIAQSFSAFAEMPAPDNQVFAWNALVEEVTRLYRSDEVAIETDCEREVLIEADKDIFRRILNNIVLNAIQSVEEKEPSIVIKLQKKSDKALLSVRDNGKGVSEDLKDKIFLNYFSTKATGSGIGLALAKKGIENAGGNIWFESEEGKGTTFFISMPLVHR